MRGYIAELRDQGVSLSPPYTHTDFYSPTVSLPTSTHLSTMSTKVLPTVGGEHAPNDYT